MKFMQKIVSAGFVASLVFTGVATTPIFSSIFSTNAYAQTSSQTSSAKSRVDQAKAQGLVGEQLDGYIGFVTPGISADIRAAVNEINIKRKSIFTKTARAKKVSVATIAGLTGEKLTTKAKPGEKIKLGDGSWRVVGRVAG